MKPVLIAAILSIVSATSASLRAQGGQPFDFYGRGPYRPGVPRPSEVLGYGAGQRHTQYAQQQVVLDRMIAAAPDRVRTEVIGTTEEGRVMRVLIVTAPENIARLEEIRADLGRLTDAARTTPQEAAAIAARTPSAVFLSYSIHGNEPAGFEAVMWVAYQLLASEEPATLEILRNVVVLLNPSANPDGHERFAVWYNSLSLGTDEPFGYEAVEPWDIQGRFGHYRFDMNRDLIAQSHAPTRAMLSALMRWHPQVVVDHHSTVQPFFFAPAALPLNANLPPHAARWQETFGRGNAAAFDAHGWQYNVRDVFDLFYPGYWDAGPALHGATGMTYETDGGPELAIRQDDGTVITFTDGIAHHMVASLATLATAAANREQRLRDFYDFHRTAIEEARAGRMKRVVILPDNDPTNAARLSVLLLRHGIRVGRLTQPLASAAARRYLDGPSAAATRQTFPAGALVVDLAQSEGRLAKALLEPRAELDSSFERRQMERFQRNRRRGDDAEREGYEFYDVTAWSLPYTLGLEAYWTEDAGPAAVEALSLPPDSDPVRALAPLGTVSGRARSAYVFRNDRQAAAELAFALLREGFVLGVARESLRADGRRYPRGTFIARVARNAPTLPERISALAREIGVPVDAIESAFPDSGQVGVGSRRVEPVFRPRILVAMGAGISQTSYGATWHFLEQELRQPFTAVALSAIGRMHTLPDYNVLIIPTGARGTMQRELGEPGADRLKRWVQDGGAVIGFGGGAELLGKGGIQLSTVEPVGVDADTARAKRDTLPSGAQHTPPLASPTGGATHRPEEIPGAIFRATLDRAHWLTAGYERTHLAVLLDGSTMLKASAKGDNPVAFVGDSLVLSGFVWPGNTERLLKGTVWAASERVGRGHAVLFAADPLFRAFWRSAARLLTNAILLGPGR
ncbi:MAG TPA: M14 family zinc carboxypeptidase [Gemmatimonadales bacterium]|nr:M14 family zinc carboxypeptidase [Gemmatimonadales bacterium]